MDAKYLIVLNAVFLFSTSAISVPWIWTCENSSSLIIFNPAGHVTVSGENKLSKSHTVPETGEGPGHRNFAHVQGACSHSHFYVQQGFDEQKFLRSLAPDCDPEAAIQSLKIWKSQGVPSGKLIQQRHCAFFWQFSAGVAAGVGVIGITLSSCCFLLHQSKANIVSDFYTSLRAGIFMGLFVLSLQLLEIFFGDEQDIALS